MASPPVPRANGWTPDRQVTFLAALAGTRSVSAAARAAGMSRESAHRLRNRTDGALFAHLWDLALAPLPHATSEGHSERLGDGQLARLLGTYFRRESGKFFGIHAPDFPAGDSDRT